MTFTLGFYPCTELFDIWWVNWNVVSACVLLQVLKSKTLMCSGDSDTYPFLFAEMAEADIEAGGCFARQVTDFLHFMHKGGWKLWGERQGHDTHSDETALVLKY